MNDTPDPSNQPRSPVSLQIPLLLMGVMWIVLVVVTGWAYMAVHGQSAPAPDGSGPAVVLTLDPEGLAKVVQKFQFLGLLSIGVLTVLVIVGLSVSERKKRE